MSNGLASRWTPRAVGELAELRVEDVAAHEGEPPAELRASTAITASWNSVPVMPGHPVVAQDRVGRSRSDDVEGGRAGRGEDRLVARPRRSDPAEEVADRRLVVEDEDADRSRRRRRRRTARRRDRRRSPPAPRCVADRRRAPARRSRWAPRGSRRPRPSPAPTGSSMTKRRAARRVRLVAERSAVAGDDPERDRQAQARFPRPGALVVTNGMNSRSIGSRPGRQARRRRSRSGRSASPSASRSARARDPDASRPADSLRSPGRR